MEVTIRKMTESDWVSIQKLNIGLFEYDNDFFPDLDMKWPLSETGISYYKKVAKGEDDFQGFIAEIGGEPIGYVALKKGTMSWRMDPYVEIVNIYVTNDYRSKGIGADLMQIARVWAKEQKISNLHVSTSAQNIDALRFYNKHGFTEIGIDLEKKI